MSAFTRALVLVSMVLVLSGIATPSHAADRILRPENYGAAFNGFKIYVSPAEHGGENVGCDGYVEDYNMRRIARRLALSIDISDPGSLVERGYRVRLGDGNVNQAVARSNEWLPNRHVAIHSNANGRGRCPGRSFGEGTRAFYMPGRPASRDLARDLAGSVGPNSPGSGDGPREGPQYIEINSVNAPVSLIETEFHTWLGGANWIRRNRETVAWLIAIGIERHLGYPS